MSAEQEIADLVAERMDPEPNAFEAMNKMLDKAMKAFRDEADQQSRFFTGTQWPVSLRRNGK